VTVRPLRYIFWDIIGCDDGASFGNTTVCSTKREDSIISLALYYICSVASDAYCVSGTTRHY